MSVARAVTATSFQEGETYHVLNKDKRSNDGDIEDKDDHNDDGLVLSKCTQKILIYRSYLFPNCCVYAYFSKHNSTQEGLTIQASPPANMEGRI